MGIDVPAVEPTEVAIETGTAASEALHISKPSRRLLLRRRVLLIAAVLILALAVVVTVALASGDIKTVQSDQAPVPDDHAQSSGYSRFQHGMEYMATMKNQTVAALSLNGHGLSWYHLDDVVMGGHSASSVTVDGTGTFLNFSGVISTRDGGFASCATLTQPLGLPAAATGLNVTLSGNGELFQFSVRTSASAWAPTWQADLPAKSLEAGVLHSLLLPFSAFVASRFGQPVSGAVLDPTAIVAVGLSLALLDTHHDPNPHFREGPFQLLLHGVAAVTAPLAPQAAKRPPPPPTLLRVPPPLAAAVGPPSAPTLLASFGSGGSHQWHVMNDPVMGGRSHSSLRIADGVATFAGTCAVVPFLHAPGFCKMGTRGGTFPDASRWIDGGLHLTLRSSSPAYRGFKIDFSSRNMPAPQGFRHGYPAFKAGFELPPSARAEFVRVRVPFSDFSVDTSEYTGRCDTTDPTGVHHHCCTAAHPEVCVAAHHLRTLTAMQVWAEGVEGAFSLQIRSIEAGP